MSGWVGEADEHLSVYVYGFASLPAGKILTYGTGAPPTYLPNGPSPDAPGEMRVPRVGAVVCVRAMRLEGRVCRCCSGSLLSQLRFLADVDHAELHDAHSLRLRVHKCCTSRPKRAKARCAAAAARTSPRAPHRPKPPRPPPAPAPKHTACDRHLLRTFCSLPRPSRTCNSDL